MRLELKLAAFGIIVLLPKTEAYLSNAQQSETQTTSELAMLAPVAHWHVSSTSDPTFFAEGKQGSTCAAKPRQDTSDTAAFHAMHESPKGS